MKYKILCLIVTFIVIFYIISNNKFESWNNNVTLIILSYNRLHNVDKLVKIYSKYDSVDKIIIGHGNPKYYKEYEGDKIINIKDYKRNKKYKVARRFFLAKYTNSKYILNLDDDMLLSEKYVKKLINNIKRNDNAFYGGYERVCNKIGYSYHKSKRLKYNTILTGVSIISKDIIKKWLRHPLGFKKYRNFIKKYDNCGDLGLNLFLMSQNIPRIYIKPDKDDIKLLDWKGGYQDRLDHYQLRTNFCKKNFALKGKLIEAYNYWDKRKTDWMVKRKNIPDKCCSAFEKMYISKFIMNKTVLCIGVGTGRYLKCFVGAKFIYGIDLIKEFIEYANKIKPINSKLSVDNVVNMKFNKQVDVIYTLAVLQHINPNDIQRAINNIIKLNVNDIILVEVDNTILKSPNIDNTRGNTVYMWGHNYIKLFKKKYKLKLKKLTSSKNYLLHFVKIS